MSLLWRPYSVGLFMIACAVCIFPGCASPISPTGGPADTTPPVVIVEESTPNRQTNFTADEIILTFDEWVTLNDVYSQLVISPPMPDEPEITQRKKSVVIKLPDSLRESTTYTINFGDAITDLNEGNVLDNYVFVFSTGPQLDSIQINGIVINAEDLKPADDIWVMLYNTGEDSAVYKRKPDYLAKTNSGGNWTISFLPSDSFNVVALQDENLNFLYDQESEFIGWLNEPIFTGDADIKIPPVYVFPRDQRTIIKEIIHVSPGWLKMIVDAPFPKPSPDLLPGIDGSISIWEGDTLHVWYDPLNIYSGYAVLGEDSTLIRRSTEPSLLKTVVNINQVTGRIRPGSEAVFGLDIPIQTIDRSRVIVEHDSLGPIPFEIITNKSDARQLSIKAPWVGVNRYQVTFLPSAIVDFWGRINDTIRHSIIVSGADQYGDLTMRIDSLNADRQYIILLRQGEQTIDTFVVVGTTNRQILRTGLAPASYVIEIIEDLNRNGSWDTGSYASRRQPERKLIFTPEALRAGWEQEIKMTWK